MIRAFQTLVAIGLPFLLNGCVFEKQGQEEKEATREPLTNLAEEEMKLTAAKAKKALLEMDSRKIPPGVIVSEPKDEPIQFTNADEISIGKYYCNLKEKTFHASTEFPNADRHRFNQVSGVFERTAECKWVAKITDSLSGH